MTTTMSLEGPLRTKGFPRGLHKLSLQYELLQHLLHKNSEDFITWLAAFFQCLLPFIRREFLVVIPTFDSKGYRLSNFSDTSPHC